MTKTKQKNYDGKNNIALKHPNENASKGNKNGSIITSFKRYMEKKKVTSRTKESLIQTQNKRAAKLKKNEKRRTKKKQKRYM